jgi:hypothetical protein
LKSWFPGLKKAQVHIEKIIKIPKIKMAAEFKMMAKIDFTNYRIIMEKFSKTIGENLVKTF